jgi:hypothetical protein
MVILELVNEDVQKLGSRIDHSFEIIAHLLKKEKVREIDKIFLHNLRNDLLVIRETLLISTEEDLPW